MFSREGKSISIFCSSFNCAVYQILVFASAFAMHHPAFSHFWKLLISSGTEVLIFWPIDYSVGVRLIHLLFYCVYLPTTKMSLFFNRVVSVIFGSHRELQMFPSIVNRASVYPSTKLKLGRPVESVVCLPNNSFLTLVERELCVRANHGRHVQRQLVFLHLP